MDGVFGPSTAAAVAAFQWANGLSGHGIPGPRTLKLIALKMRRRARLRQSGAGVVPAGAPPDGAARDRGTREQSGDHRHGPARPALRRRRFALVRVVSFAHCLSTLAREPLPTNVLRAQAWKTFGKGDRAHAGRRDGVLGATSPTAAWDTVGFYAGEDDKGYRILGGNQSNSVSLAWYEKDRFLVAARWPATVPLPHARPVRGDTGRGLRTTRRLEAIAPVPFATRFARFTGFGKLPGGRPRERYGCDQTRGRGSFRA
ncbi:peptidoglycan-binding protein [Sphingomonas sp. MMS24-JH45]